MSELSARPAASPCPTSTASSGSSAHVSALRAQPKPVCFLLDLSHPVACQGRRGRSWRLLSAPLLLHPPTMQVVLPAAAPAAAEPGGVVGSG